MSKTASWRNGYCESGFADKRDHAEAIDFWRFAIRDAGLSDRLLANADTAGKEQHHGSPHHRVVPHRVSRTLNFGQFERGFNSGRSAGRSG